MSFWVLALVVFDILLLFGLVMIWGRLHRAKEDDPRLSRGLQMLSSKLSILEDLSLRTDTQVDQVTTLIDRKIQQVTEVIEQCNRQLQQIESAQQKSSEIAQIFQDKIPHQEIIERQTTLKYIQAAKMIQDGKNLDDVQSMVGLSFGEIELIANMDIDYLKNIENQLKGWQLGHVEMVTPVQKVKANHSEAMPAAAQVSNSAKPNADAKLKELGEKFSKMPELQPQQKNVKYFQFPRI